MALPTRRGNEGSSRSSEVEAPASGVPRTVPLTVKLRGRTTTPDKRCGRTLSPGARGTKQTAPHGPLQRLLECRPVPVTGATFKDLVVAGTPRPSEPVGTDDAGELHPVVRTV